MLGEILEYLKMHDVKYKENIKLATISPIRIGAEASLVIFPDEESKLCELAIILRKLKIKYKIVGRMSNLLPPDEKYDGVVVRCDLLNGCSVSGNMLTVSSGALLASCAKLLCENGLSGFEGLAGIPGSIGGALMGNAGAFGQEISDTLADVRVFDFSSESIKSVSAYDCNFAYRFSSLKTADLVILSARFLLNSSNKDRVFREMERCRQIRLNTQPREPSLGSTFKKPSENVYAARLIDRCGLKGCRVGGAEISSKHAGFIINRGGATARDYLQLSEYAKECVYEKYNISLLREIEIMR